MDARVCASGELRITLTDRVTGEVREIVEHNRVVDSGLLWIVACCLNPTSTFITTMAIGDGATPVYPTDSGLAHELARVQVGAGGSGASIVVNATFNMGQGTGNISELALFLGSGALFARSVIPAQNKSADTQMQVQWTITLQAA